MLGWGESRRRVGGRATFTLAIHGLQAMWVLALVVAVRQGVRRHAGAFTIVLAPVAFLAVHLVYHVHGYYPRHIVAGYLMMGVSAMFVTLRSGGQARF